MALTVQKFGGSSVADTEKIKRVAGRVTRTFEEGNSVVVVISALGDTTDKLVKLAHEICEMPPEREMDMLLSTGEQVSVALLSMAIQTLGYEAISFTGAQVGILTDSAHTKAKIIDIKAARILEEISKGRIVIVAGFQGITLDDHITTLGRGGSDTTAVALAAALGARGVRDLHGRRRRLHGRPAAGAGRTQAGQRLLRRDAGDGRHRGQGDAVAQY